MRVEDAMSRDVWPCRPDEPAQSAARLMWDHDIGAVPVTDPGGTLIGITTDRDICMAAYVAGTPLAALPVSDTMSYQVFTVGPDEPLEAAEQIMRSNHVRRLPVVREGKLVGLLSLADVARAEAAASGATTASDGFAAVLRDIVHPRMHIGNLTRAKVDRG